MNAKQFALLAVLLASVGCADRQKQQQQQTTVENRPQTTSQGTDETLDPGGYDPFAATADQDVFPLDNGSATNVSGTVDPSTQGLQDSSTLAAGTINPGNNGASGGGGVNQAAMMQGMMGMMTSMMSGQQPNPAALMGMFASAIPGGSAAGGMVTQLAPLLSQAVQ